MRCFQTRWLRTCYTKHMRCLQTRWLSARYEQLESARCPNSSEMKCLNVPCYSISFLTQGDRCIIGTAVAGNSRQGRSRRARSRRSHPTRGKCRPPAAGSVGNSPPSPCSGSIQASGMGRSRQQCRSGTKSMQRQEHLSSPPSSRLPAGSPV